MPGSRPTAHIPRLGSAVLVHGFTRAPRHLRVLSERLNERGIATVRPALSAVDWWHGINNAQYLTVVADRLAGGLPAGPVAVVGHSAGAAAGAWIGARLLDRGVDVRRWVAVDGVESPARLIERAWPQLGAIEVRAVVAPPSRCNRQGQLSAWLDSQDGDIETILIDGSGHGDIEVIRSPIYRRACGDVSSDETRSVVLQTVVRLVEEGLTPAQ
jgi:pimeloyl-ACP methyl ester carboxylesterase